MILLKINMTQSMVKSTLEDGMVAKLSVNVLSTNATLCSSRYLTKY